MKIKVETPPVCKAVICLQEDCPWDKVCANHVSAGDFRTEDGAIPRLTLRRGEVFCETIHSKDNGYEYHEEPLIQGSPGLKQGMWHSNCVLWEELQEIVDTFEI